ncbi:MAG: capsid assembly scaffolding protein Gp46 family protein [Vagococcus salmoninarum]|uniref:capsid assembly scaffolding protein Gp46 family protein n=1 Tax=Vagococcus salmoninarum TaxID=2739 RepID=UPI003F965DB5
MKTKQLLPMNLQFFAEPPADPVDPAEPKDPVELDTSKLTEEQLAAIKEAQGWHNDDEVDTIVKAKKAKLNAEKEEEVRLSKLSEEERRQEQDQALIAEVEQLRLDKKRNELRGDAIAELTTLEIQSSQEVLELVVADDSEATLARIKSVKALIDKTVKETEDRVKAEFKGAHYPSFQASKKQVADRQSILAIEDRAERLTKMAENKDLFPEIK